MDSLQKQRTSGRESEIEPRELWQKKFDIIGDEVYCVKDDEEGTEINAEIVFAATNDGIYTVNECGKENYYEDGFWFTDKAEAERHIDE